MMEYSFVKVKAKNREDEEERKGFCFLKLLYSSRVNNNTDRRAFVVLPQQWSVR